MNFNKKQILTILIISLSSGLFCIYSKISFKTSFLGLEGSQSPLVFCFALLLAIIFGVLHLKQKDVKLSGSDLFFVSIWFIFVYLYFMSIKIWPASRFICSISIFLLLFIIKRSPTMVEFFNKKTHHVFILLFLVLWVRDPIIFAAIFYLSLNILIFNSKFYNQMVSNVLVDFQTIQGHWKNDADLVFIWKFVICFLILQVLITIRIINLVYYMGPEMLVSIEWYSSTDANSLKVWGYAWIINYVGVNLMLLLINLQVIWFRNTPVREKVLSTCINCVAFGIATGGVALAGTVGMSYTPLCEPTPIGNAYQMRWGRGFGFSTQSANLRHNMLMGNDAYRSILPSVIGKELMITDSSINMALQNKKITAGLTFTQRQILGL